MGCPLSTQLVYPANGEVSDVKSLQLQTNGAGGGEKSTVKLPLTERDVFSITKSWKTISKNMTNIGVAIFIKMFETSAQVKLMFEQFRAVEKEDLYTNRSLENHALLVMNALDESIANLDDPDYLFEMLLTTGKSHRRFENFSPDVFWNIEEPFIQAVKETLADRFTPYMEKIYRKTIRFVLTTLIAGFNENHVSNNATNSILSADGFAPN